MPGTEKQVSNTQSTPMWNIKLLTYCGWEEEKRDGKRLISGYEARITEEFWCALT